MANATIQSLTQTQTANFSIAVMFPNGAVTGLEKTDINLRARTENGITGVDFSITGTQPTANFTLMFTLPSNAQGSFEISITGMVTPQGGSTPEAVMSNSVVVHYDTTGNVTVTFGTVEYRDGGEIAVPVTFGEAVVANAKTVFPITHVSGDDLAGIEYYLLGENTAYELVFTVPPDRSGRFQVAANGDVLLATGTWENVMVTAKTVAYNTGVPKLKNYDIPEYYVHTENFNVILQFDTDCTVNNPMTFFDDLNATYLDFFIFEGADLGTPNLYRKIDDVYPTLPLPASLGTDWTQTDLQTTEATIYLLRWDAVSNSAEGIFNITVKPGFVLGPVKISIKPTGDYVSDGAGNFLTDGAGNFITGG